MQRLQRLQNPTRIRKRIVARMCEGHVTSTEGEILTKDGDGVSELMAAVVKGSVVGR